MSRISNIAYPRSMVGGTSAGLWKTLDEQNLGLGITGQDQFENIDTAAIGNPLTSLSRSQFYGQQTMGLGGVSVSPKKFRIVCQEVGFIPHTVKVFIKGNLLHVIGLVEDTTTGVPFTKVFKQKYPVPQTADIQRLVKLFTERGQLVIEMPIVGSQAYPNIAGSKFAGLGLGALEQEQEHLAKVNVVINMAQEEDKAFEHQMDIPSYYNRSLNMPLGSDISSPFGWNSNPYKRAPYQETLGSNLDWELGNLAGSMPKSSMGYKPYRSYAC